MVHEDAAAAAEQEGAAEAVVEAGDGEPYLQASATAVRKIGLLECLARISAAMLCGTLGKLDRRGRVPAGGVDIIALEDNEQIKEVLPYIQSVFLLRYKSAGMCSYRKVQFVRQNSNEQAFFSVLQWKEEN